MNWLLIVFGAILLTPAAIVVLVLWLRWTQYAADVMKDDPGRELEDYEKFFGWSFWLVTFASLTALGIAALDAGIG